MQVAHAGLEAAVVEGGGGEFADGGVHPVPTPRITLKDLRLSRFAMVPWPVSVLASNLDLQCCIPHGFTIIFFDRHYVYAMQLDDSTLGGITRLGCGPPI